MTVWVGRSGPKRLDDRVGKRRQTAGVREATVETMREEERAKSTPLRGVRENGQGQGHTVVRVDGQTDLWLNRGRPDSCAGKGGKGTPERLGW